MTGRPSLSVRESRIDMVQYVALIKLEKLDMIIRLTSQANIAQVLSELKEYSTEVDIHFVRKSVQSIVPLLDVLSRWSRVLRAVALPSWTRCPPSPFPITATM
jgi:vesicle coat complex subunit